MKALDINVLARFLFLVRDNNDKPKPFTGIQKGGVRQGT